MSGIVKGWSDGHFKEGYREKVKLASKLPVWLVQTADELDRFLNEQLERLQTDHLDFYLLHGLNKRTWPKIHELEVFNWAERAIKDGRFLYLGFSFHDDYEVFKEIIDAYDKWTFCQIQYNFMDTEYQAGTKGLKYAAEKGLAVVIMEPIRGGQLAKKPPETVVRLWESAPIKRSPAEWALQWVWNQPEVSTVLSGMTTMDQVIENVESANRSDPNISDPGRIIFDRTSSGRIQKTVFHPLYQLQILSSLSEQREYSRDFGVIQRCFDVC